MGCFLHTAVRGSFPRQTWGFSDALCFSYSLGTACEGQEQGLRGLPVLFYGRFSKGSSGNVTPAVLLLCSDRGKREEKKTTAVWDSDQVFRRIYPLSFKDHFSKLLQHLSARKLKETVWRRLLVCILKFRFITNNQAPVEYKLVALHLRN